jgi:hypothetical protein
MESVDEVEMTLRRCHSAVRSAAFSEINFACLVDVTGT